MNAIEARDIIFGFFKDVWDPREAVYGDIPGKIPPSESTWARVSIKHVIGGQSSLSGESGTRRFTNQGTVFFQIFAPVGDGSTACYTAAQEVLDAFREAQHPDVWFRDAKLVEVGADGAFNQINVSVTFSYDDVR